MSLTVAVVIPAFNAERYLLQAATSVLTQTLTDLQLVIVDDGSTDGTLECARSLHDGRVQVITGPNRGPALARNTGWRSAWPSEFVAFLDADDCWDRDKLQLQVDYLRADPELVAVGCIMRYVSSDKEILGHTGHWLGEADLHRIRSGAFCPFPTSSMLVRQTALQAVGGFDETHRFTGSEDLDLMARLAQHGNIQCIARALGSYRIHPHSIMAGQRAQVNREARFVRARLASRAAGQELTWEQFEATHLPSWRERRQDLVERLYRTAAVHRAQRQWLRALGSGMLAALVNPRYTLRRVSRQVWKTGSKGTE